MSKESEFLGRLRETFKGEAEEHRAAMLSGLLELEQGKSGGERDSAVIEGIFREAHSLKGAARAVDIGGIERLCQSVETIFSGLKQGHRRPRKKTFDLLYRTLDLIPELMRGARPGSDGELEEVLKLLKVEAKAGPDAAKSTDAPVAVEDQPAVSTSRKTASAMSETVRISAARLGSIFLHAEEMLSVKQSMARHAADLDELQVLERSRNREWINAGPVIRSLRQHDAGDPLLKKLLDTLDWHIDQSSAMKLKLDGMDSAAALDSLHTGERVDSLLTEIRTALMLPFSTLLELFPRMVRDLAVEEGKEVDWDVRGEDTQIDRRVLEEIKDALIHIVRNSISHGIETPGEREKLGKPRRGTVTLQVERADNDKVELTLRDDGAGVDLAKVKAAAVARGYLTPAGAAALSNPDALRLIFLSQLSTSQIVTDIAGRGLGLAIAREKIENIGGLIAVDATQGKGITFRIQIPLSLATFRGVLVRVRARTFVIPTVNVEKVLRQDAARVVLLENRQSITMDGRAVSLVNLGDLLGVNPLPEEQSAEQSYPVVVLLVSGTRIAFRIDEIAGEQEVLVKNLGRQLARVRNISGATVLVTGDVVPILNPSDLLKSASLATQSAPSADAREPEGPAARRILVVEDSVTSRMLLKGILESAGYQVRTAVDGVEAFASLRVDACDLVVSDIDMPRMNGFALCEKVRGFARTADIPIVLVTTLDSREDREKGIDAGANAYIVKSSFDQSNLLEVVKRLL
jgi:two-component system, chemotaxis family, sensor kinase CheA